MAAPPHSANLTQDISRLHPSIFLVCYRTKNKNVVIYEANVVNGKFADTPIDAYWLLLEPSYQAPRTKKGIRHNREELSWLDKRFAWGYTQRRLSDLEAEITFNNFPKVPLRIKLSNDGSTKAFIQWKNQQYFLRSFFIDASDTINLLNVKDNFKSISFNCMNITKKPYVPETLEFKSMAEFNT
jgi:hypothetical protein